MTEQAPQLPVSQPTCVPVRLEVVAQEVDEEAPRVDVVLDHLAVDRDGDAPARDGLHQRLSRAAATARTASTSARCRR